MSAFDRSTLVKWDQRYLWHPFTPHSAYPNEDPLMIVGGDGHYLIDADGRRLLDAVSSLWCSILGHRRPEIDAAVHAQVDKIAHSTFLGNASEPAVRLAKRLVEIAPPGLSRVFYSDNGSTSVEVALKMAYQYHQQVGSTSNAQRKSFLTVGNAYHGDTIGAVSVGGIDLFHQVYHPLLFETQSAPSPYCYRCPLGLSRDRCQIDCTAELVRKIHAMGEHLAAVVMEPGMQGAAGMINLPEGSLRKVRDACDQVGTLLILDEVAMGFGRTGKMFACDHEKVTPDFLCLAKGLTGGYLPMAATLTTEQIFEAFLGPPEDGKTFFHGHTYTGNQLGAAAALATLDVLEEEQIIAAVAPRITQLTRELEELWKHTAVGDIRQAGLAAGIELVADRAEKTPFDSAKRVGMKVCLAARKHGVFLRPLGDVIVLMPPLTITESELSRIVSAISAGIAEVCGNE
ncbi:MAG TPA: adenosylmethionine--8-amino-7-oxononanoate transaminase [Myxococcales bacterium]|nr:adenosylmethionine--8-amino-7-oxononanoate transaminase [Myxococcales bacterium]HIN86030.1 adenosylmethionine--8-amino-7-oxononanoate transaminase [Myxococcales bacterium]